MKTAQLAVLLAGAALPCMAADVGVSLSIGQPGFYGQINIGNVQPPVVYSQPTVIEQDPGYVGGPVYLHVPPGHEKHWAKHCAEYNACGRPVYFVRDDWYNNQYAPRHGRGGDDDEGEGPGHGQGRGHGNGNGNGHGHGHGHGDDSS